jgi:S-adenosylmethionine synthetase
VQIAYAIGVARPVSINVTTFGTGKISDTEIEEQIKKTFDLRPASIISTLKLNELPKLNGGKFYRNVAAYGHFGRPDLDLPWERTDKVTELKKSLSNAAVTR